MASVNWRITHIKRNPYGSKIVAVKCENYAVFSVDEVIHNIENNRYDYYVQERTPKTDVHVVSEEDGSKYIRTDADATDKNNLENLPLF